MIQIPIQQYLKDLASFTWSQNFHKAAQAGTNDEMIKADPSLLFGWSIFNNAAYPIFVKLHNTSVAPAAGSTKVAKTFGVPAGQNVSDSLDSGILFDKGLAITITKLMPDDDATVVLKNDCVVDLQYR